MVRVTHAYQQRYSLLTLDARKTFDNMKRRAILPALSDLIPVAVPSALNVCIREAPKLLFRTATGEMETIRSFTGVQQGCNLGPLFYSAGLL